MQWPFGYGLTYTTFEYSDIQASDATTRDESIDITFTVKNTGQVAADEVAQIYISPAGDEGILRPIQLQGFARVSLQPGESRSVSVRLYVEQFGFYSNDGKRQWNINPGQFIVKVGASSTDIRLSRTVNITGKPVHKPLREYYFSESR